MNNTNKIVTSGFVSVIGRPNSGKSTLLNSIANTPLALVSKKANATRKRMDIIIPYNDMKFDSQIIFIDTPGLHDSNKLLNEYMIQEAYKAIGDSDLSIFISVASKNQKEINFYEDFINKYNKKHILILNKIDLLTKADLLTCIKGYEKYHDKYISLIPTRATKLNNKDINNLLYEIAKNLPNHPHFYDNEIISTTLMRDIYKEAIREAIFERLSDELPYESDVKILKIAEKQDTLYIKAQIIVSKDSQKSMIIGKNGNTIKSLGILSRNKCENLAEKKVFLELYVKTINGWNKDKKLLKKVGYDFDT